MSGSILGFSLPNFWIGLMLILFFAVELKMLPASGRGETVTLLGVPVSFLTLDGLKHLLLPALTLSLYKAALVVQAGACRHARGHLAGLHPVSRGPRDSRHPAASCWCMC